MITTEQKEILISKQRRLIIENTTREPVTLSTLFKSPDRADEIKEIVLDGNEKTLIPYFVDGDCIVTYKDIAQVVPMHVALVEHTLVIGYDPKDQTKAETPVKEYDGHAGGE